MTGALDIAVLGLSLRPDWANDHAATWRPLVRALLKRGHRVRFYERQPDGLVNPPEPPADLAPCLVPYDSVEGLRATHGRDIASADVAMLGSCVPEGARLGDWLLRDARGITAFYDIDTPSTLAKLRKGDCDYLRASQIAGFHLYLSCSGGASLQRLRRRHGAHARTLYRGVDPQIHAPSDLPAEFDLGYHDTYSPDRQKLLRWYLLGVAAAWPQGHFVVAGTQYPRNIAWPGNVARIEHLAPLRHRAFYGTQRFTLSLTRADVSAVGWSPGARLLEAAACGLPVISDVWPGIDAFFTPGREILLAHEPGQVLDWLRSMPDTARGVIGAAARRRVLAEHTADHRVETLERYIDRVVPTPRVRQVARNVCQGNAAGF